MRPGKSKERGIQKILARSRQLLGRREAPQKYTAIHKLIADFETAYFKVTGGKVHIIYRKGYYYFDHVKWNHSRLEKEFCKLLQKEQKLNQEDTIQC